MTNEEAKRRMEICRDFLANNYSDMGEPNFTAFNMAIQALSQEPTDDAISLKAVCDILEDIRDCISVEGYWAILERLKKLPPVTQKSGKWIPVSERLPEDGTYLVTVERIVGNPRIDIKSFAKDLHKVDEFDFPKHKSGWYDYDSEYGYWEDVNVIAWMPLPKPYEPQESEDKE